MIETKAVFKRKDTEIEAADCVVDKVIDLSGAAFDLFSKNLMREWAFIRDNPIDTVVDKEGRYHCLLVTGEDRSDGILVNPEGAGYARYSAFMPNAAAMVAAERYPTLSDLTQRLVKAADYIVALAADGDAAATHSVSFQSLRDRFGIHFRAYDSITDTFTVMLQDRPEIALARHSADAFIVDAAAPDREIANTHESDAVADALNDTDHEFDAWQYHANENEAEWREDKRYRQHKDGALYYCGGESGQYMRIAGDGRLTVGNYELARLGIEDAVLVSHATRQFGSYEQAFLKASQLAGPKFASDIMNEKPSVLAQIREARKAPAPRKDKPAPDKHKGGPEL